MIKFNLDIKNEKSDGIKFKVNPKTKGIEFFEGEIEKKVLVVETEARTVLNIVELNLLLKELYPHVLELVNSEEMIFVRINPSKDNLEVGVGSGIEESEFINMFRMEYIAKIGFNPNNSNTPKKK